MRNLKDNTSTFITRQALTRNPNRGQKEKGQPRNSWGRDTETEGKKLGMTWTDYK